MNNKIIISLFWGTLIGLALGVPIGLNFAPNKTTLEENNKMINMGENGFGLGYYFREYDIRQNGKYLIYSDGILKIRMQNYLNYIYTGNIDHLKGFSDKNKYAIPKL